MSLDLVFESFQVEFKTRLRGKALSPVGEFEDILIGNGRARRSFRERLKDLEIPLGILGPVQIALDGSQLVIRGARVTTYFHGVPEQRNSFFVLLHAHLQTRQFQQSLVKVRVDLEGPGKVILSFGRVSLLIQNRAQVEQ